MKKQICIHEIIASRETGGGPYEIHAAMDSLYDEAKQQLIVELDSFLLSAEIKGHPQPLRPAWLPRRDTLREAVELADAVDEAKEIFSNWVGKVRRAVPDSIPETDLARAPGL